MLPLTELTKGKSCNKININENVLNAFDQLKEALCSTSVLRTARYDRDFIVQTDASLYAVGAVLDDDGSEHPIAFSSCKIFRDSTAMERS